MKTIKRITVSNLCSQNWGDMTDISGGKFCGNCQKNVVDFSGLTADEILAWFKGASNLCGRFEKNQLDQVNYVLSQNRASTFSWKKVGLGLVFLGLTPFVKAQSNAPVKTEQGPVSPAAKNPMEGPDCKIISGIVIAADDKLPIPGVVVGLQGLNIGTVTDSNGKFTIEVPKICKALTFSFIGYEMQTIRLRKLRDGSIDPELRKANKPIEMRAAMMGGLSAEY